MFNVGMRAFLYLLQAFINLRLRFFVNFDDLFITNRVNVICKIRQNKQNLPLYLGDVVFFLIFRLLRYVSLLF